MGAAAMALLFSGYSLGLWGWCLLAGKNASLVTLVNPLKVVTWQSIGPAGNSMVFPDGGPAGAADGADTAGSSGGSGGAAPAQPAGGLFNTTAISAAAAQYGWQSGGQYNALTHLIAGESDGRSDVRNPSSGALGVGQALGHGTKCSAGTLGNDYGPQYGLSCGEARAANSGDAYQQSRWTMGYIAQRYGSPEQAYSAWLGRSPHWY